MHIHVYKYIFGARLIVDNALQGSIAGKLLNSTCPQHSIGNHWTAISLANYTVGRIDL